MGRPTVPPCGQFSRVSRVRYGTPRAARARTKARDRNKRPYYARRTVIGSTIFARVVTHNTTIEAANFEDLCNAEKESTLV